MGISKKKRKFIKKNFPKCTVDEIATNTGFSVQDIKKVIGINQSKKKINLSEILSIVFEWGILVSVFIAPFILLPELRDAANLPQNAFVQVSTFFLIIVWAYKGIIDGKIEFISAPIVWPLIFFLIWSLISFFVAINPFESIPVILQVLAMVIYFMLVLNIYFKKENFNMLITALFLAGAGIALIGISQHLFDLSVIPQARPPAATFANRNMASQFMVLVFPFGLYLFLKTEKPLTGWFAAILSGFILVYVVYTKSLAAWISIAAETAVLFVMLFIYIIKNKWQFNIKSKLSSLLTTMVIFLLLINMDSNGVNLKFSGVSDQVTSVREFVAPSETKAVTQKKVSTIEWRWSVWLNSMALIRDNFLFGVGIGNYSVEYPLYNQAVIKDQKFSIEFQPVRAHNDYVQAAAELGLTGLAIIIFAILCFYYILIVLLKGCLPRENILLVITILSAGFGIILNAGFSFPFQRAIPPFIVILISAIACVLYAKNHKTKVYQITAPYVLYSILTGLILLSGYYLYYHYSMIQFDKFYGRTIKNYNQANWSGLIDDAHKAQKYNTHSKMILFYMGYANYELGRVEESIQYYEELLQYFPNYINGLINLGVAYGKMNQNEKAVEMFTKTVYILPDHVGYHNNVGHYLLKTGKIEQAYDYFNKTIALDENNAITQSNLGTVCVLMEKYSEAKQAFQKAVELKPGWEKPLQYLKLIEAKQKEKK